MKLRRVAHRASACLSVPSGRHWSVRINVEHFEVGVGGEQVGDLVGATDDRAGQVDVGHSQERPCLVPEQVGDESASDDRSTSRRWAWSSAL